MQEKVLDNMLGFKTKLPADKIHSTLNKMVRADEIAVGFTCMPLKWEFYGEGVSDMIHPFKRLGPT